MAFTTALGFFTCTIKTIYARNNGIFQNITLAWINDLVLLHIKWLRGIRKESISVSLDGIVTDGEYSGILVW
jgi:hypothetical protein